MKKNYLEPKVKVQTIALQSMMQAGSDESGIGGQDVTPAIHDRDDLLDDWSL